MDHSRKANREGNERTLQYKSRQETLLDEELAEDKLTELLASVIRFTLLPDVDPVLAVVMIADLDTVQPRRLADLRQDLGFDLLGVVRLGLCHHSGLFFVRDGLWGLCHSFLGW